MTIDLDSATHYGPSDTQVKQSPVTATIRMQHADTGIPVDLRVDLSTGILDKLPGMVQRLAQAGFVAPQDRQAAPGVTPAPAAAAQGATSQPGQAPTCPHHPGRQMKPSKFGDGFYCSAKTSEAPDGSVQYCGHKISAA